MFALGATELILVVLAGLIIYFTLRGCVLGGLLMIPVIVLSPLVAFALAMLVRPISKAILIRPR
jgi:hypothetical protein